jgi:hypothetical protein
VLQLSAIVTSSCTKQVEITLADPVFDPQRQTSRKFFWCPERLISSIVWQDFNGTRCSEQTQDAKRQLMQEDRTDRQARMRPPISSQSDPDLT